MRAIDSARRGSSSAIRIVPAERPGGTSRVPDVIVAGASALFWSRSAGAAPAMRPQPSADAPATITSGTRLVPPGLSAGTILIAEDDPRLAESIARMLADTYTVVV